MPSPIGHTIAGLAVAELACEKGRRRTGQAVFFANAPDIDLLVGVIKKNPSGWHAHQTHSVGAALAAGVGAGLLARLAGRKFIPSFLESTGAYASHLLLDYLGKKQVDGMPLLWPFTKRRWASEYAWFPTILSHSRERGFFAGLLLWHNLKAVAWEVGALLPVYLLARCVSLPRDLCARSGGYPGCV